MKLLTTAILVLLSFQAGAAIEKVAIRSDSGIRFVWWPKADPPKGWHFDSGSSQHFAFNAIAPDGSTFSKAETVMYARADYKPRIPTVKNIESYINNDIADFKRSDPGLTVTRESPIAGAGNVKFRVVSYSPAKAGSGNWERVAYGEDGDYFLTFVISSRTKAGLVGSLPAFNGFVAAYRPGS